MNYLSLINSFWDLTTINPLSTGQVSLYFALLHINNRSNWAEWFTASNQVLSVLTGLSRSGILKARNELKQRGVIDFRERGTKATNYSICIMQNSVQDSTQDGTQKGNTLKNINRNKKQKKSISNDIPESHAAYYPDENLNQAVLAFISFRREIKKPMTEHAIRLMMKKLDAMTSDNVERIAILEQSIVNGWQGVFPLKDAQRRGGENSGSIAGNDKPAKNRTYNPAEYYGDAGVNFGGF